MEDELVKLIWDEDQRIYWHPKIPIIKNFREPNSLPDGMVTVVIPIKEDENTYEVTITPMGEWKECLVIPPLEKE